MQNGLVKFCSTLSLVLLVATIFGYSTQSAVAEELGEELEPAYVQTYRQYLSIKDSILAGEHSTDSEVSDETVVPERFAEGSALVTLWRDLADFEEYGIRLKGNTAVSDWRLQQQFMDAGKRIQIVYFCNFVGGTDLLNQQGDSVKGEDSAAFVINQVIITTTAEDSVVSEEKVLGYSESCTR